MIRDLCRWISLYTLRTVFSSSEGLLLLFFFFFFIKNGVSREKSCKRRMTEVFTLRTDRKKIDVLFSRNVFITRICEFHKLHRKRNFIKQNLEEHLRFPFFPHLIKKNAANVTKKWAFWDKSGYTL